MTPHKEPRDTEPPLSPEDRALQDAIDASIQRRFTPPSSDRFNPVPSEATTTTTAPSSPFPFRRVITYALLAAACLGLAGTVYFALQSASPQGPVVRFDPIHPALAYRETVDQGFVPAWVCETDQQFIEAFQTKLGVGLLARSDPDQGIELLGIGIGAVTSNTTVTVLARVDGQPVTLFADRTEQVSPDEAQPHPDADDIYLHRRDLPAVGLTLIEASPLPQPRLLDRFERVESPPTTQPAD
ncbi:MAG: hypothetical protein AAGI68_15625 [Planctomycetota bacterium]